MCCEYNLSHADVEAVVSTVHHSFINPSEMQVGPISWPLDWIMNWQMDMQDSMIDVEDDDEIDEDDFGSLFA